MAETSLFVTGTDTGVGKTFVSALLLRRLHALGRPASYFKPVETGIAGTDPTRPEGDCAAVLAVNPWLAAVDPLRMGLYRFAIPASPHFAAARENRRIELAPILDRWRELAAGGDTVVVEGAGGLLVPLGDGLSTIDLVAALGIPVVVVARAGLGTLNHTLLTLDALRSRGLPVRGVVVNRFPANPGPVELDNLEAIPRFGNVELLGVVPETDGPAAVDVDAVFAGLA